MKKEIPSIPQGIGGKIIWLLAYHSKELLILILLLGFFTILIVNIEYTKEGGLQWKRANVSIELKR